MSTKSPYSKPEYFYNRELSWLLFNRRVLEEAKDSSLPLFDRLKFLSITSSNLDEFFMIRVASLKDMVQVKYNKKDISGMTPAEQLAAINERTHLFVKDQYDIFNRSLIPALEKEGVHVLSHYENLSDKQSKYVDRYFTDEVYPVLTPMAVDSSRIRQSGRMAITPAMAPRCFCPPDTSYGNLSSRSEIPSFCATGVSRRAISG